MLTTSTGTFTEVSPQVTCNKKRINLLGIEQSYTTPLEVPCDSTITGALALKATSAASSSAGYQEATTSLAKGASCGQCTPAASSSTSTPTGSSTNVSTDNASTTTTGSGTIKDNSNLLGAPAAADGSNGCGTSSLGYACFKQMCGNIAMHWTVGGAAPAACKYASTAKSTAGSNVVHIALESSAAGWLGAAFPKTAGSMLPADAMIGWTDASGSAAVGAYQLTGQAVSQVLADSSVTLASKGVIKQANGAQVVCFSRDLSQVGRTGVQLAGSAPGQLPNLNMIFAASTANRLSDHLHDSAHQCSATVNFATGSSTTVVSDIPRLIVIHGALMIAAWIALLPAGVLIARNKALLQPGPTWFNIHVSMQYLGLTAFLAAIALAWAKFAPLASGQLGESGSLFSAHYALGIVIIVLAVLQVLAAHGLRPKPDAPKRASWNNLHWWLGRTTLAAGVANVFVGIVLNNKKFGESMAPWLGAAIAILAALVVAGLALQVLSSRKQAKLSTQHQVQSTPAAVGKPGASSA